MNKEEFLKKIPQLSKLYVTYSSVTHVPYVVCNKDTAEDEVFAYVTEEDAMASARELAKENITVFTVSFENKNLLEFFSELFLYGVSGIVFHAEGEAFHYELTQIVTKPDPEKNVKDGKKPMIQNPALQISMIYYMQEIRKQEKTISAEEQKAMDEEMVVNMVRATYYMPFKNVEQDGKQVPQFIVMKLKNETAWIPVFTDFMEFRRFSGKQKLMAAPITFPAMRELNLPPEVKGFMLNPAGVSVSVPQEFLKNVLKKREPAEKTDAKPKTLAQQIENAYKTGEDISLEID